MNIAHTAQCRCKIGLIKKICDFKKLRPIIGLLGVNAWGPNLTNVGLGLGPIY